MNHSETLNFILKLTDEVSKPLAGVSGAWDSTTEKMHKGFANVGMGAAGLIGSAFAINKALAPAREMDKVLNELASLDVNDQALEKLAQESLRYSIEFGESATAMAGSAYDIQSAISGLTGNELATFTRSSNILAKATKADAATITDYVGTMYGIFQNQAVAMGKAEWIDQLTGQTAKAVQMFKTDGAKMSSAFAALGAEANSSGIALNEQMAIMGTLQATMSGSESATKYRAFLSGVGKAQSELGLVFTDSNGKLLPMVEILNRIKGKYGEIDTVAKSDILKKAFGTNEAAALVKLLSQNVDGLGLSIQQLGDVKGLAPALEMAKQQIDPWEQFDHAVTAVSISFGRAFLPVINPLIAGMAEALDQVVEWVHLFPHVAEALAVVGLGVLGLIAAYSALTIALGIGRIFMAGWMMLLMGGYTVLGIFKAGLMAVTAALKALRGVMAAVALVAALAGLPLWAIALAVAAIAGAVAAAVYWWDDLINAFKNTSVFQMLAKAIDYVIEKIKSIPGVGLVIDKIKGAFDTPETPQPEAVKVATEIEQVAPPANLNPVLTQTVKTDYTGDAGPDSNPLNPNPIKRPQITPNGQQGGIISQFTESLAGSSNGGQNVWHINTNEFDLAKMQHLMALEGA